MGAGSPGEMGEPPGGGRESRRVYPARGDGKGAPSLPLPCELCAPPQDWMGVSDHLGGTSMSEEGGN